jgi:hypothetical protein
MKKTHHYVSYIILFMAVIAQLGCGSLAVESKWREHEIVIDGKSDDWVGALQYFEEKNVSVGMLNDNSFLYMCLIIDQQQLRNQIMAQGLRLWFDPEGGNEKSFGIKFPIGLGMMRPNREITEEDRERMQDQDARQELFKRSLTELEILSGGIDDGLRMTVDEAKGIEIKLKMYNGQVVYECKVPLLTSEGMPYVIKARAGDAIGVGLESPKLDMQAKRDRTGGGMQGGGGRDGGMPSGGSMTGGRRGEGGRGGMSGGRDGRGGNQQLGEELKVWASAQLATKESSI